MRELIKELEYNKKINEEKGLENKVDIDYILKRLNDINIWKEFMKNEVDFVIDTLINDEELDEDTKQKIRELNKEDIDFFIIEYLEDYEFCNFNEYVEETLLKYVG